LHKKLSLDLRDAKVLLRLKQRGHDEGEAFMPSYEICYLNNDGSLAGKFAATCETQMQAKILAHAMRLDSARGIEVWDGSELIYRRPDDVDLRSSARQ
jgi:hypothetical protein